MCPDSAVDLAQKNGRLDSFFWRDVPARNRTVKHLDGELEKLGENVRNTCLADFYFRHRHPLFVHPVEEIGEVVGGRAEVQTTVPQALEAVVQSSLESRNRHETCLHGGKNGIIFLKQNGCLLRQKSEVLLALMPQN